MSQVCVPRREIWSDPLSRRGFFVAAAAACGGLTAPVVAWANENESATTQALDSHRAETPFLELKSFPRRVFKALDPGKEQMESWYLHLALLVEGTWQANRLELSIRSNGSAVCGQTFGGASLAAIRRDVPLATTMPADPRTAMLFRVRGSASQALRADSMECTLSVDGPHGEAVAHAIIPVGTYEQKSSLLFPFRGHGVVTQGGVHNGGHSNRSGQFAIDAIGLTPMYAPQLSDKEENPAAAGWGREIIAPAAGKVVFVRGDRPDQPVPGAVDPNYLLNGDESDPGNHVIIDHENGEFSMIAHLKSGSVRVSVGQSLKAGEPIGALGNSGNSNFPHVHHQLMDGPDRNRSDALPCRFENMPAQLSRGEWFEAK